jgi:hypothetical protein
MLGKFIARDFIAIAGEMRRFPASNENTESGHHYQMFKNKSSCLFYFNSVSLSFAGMYSE